MQHLSHEYQERYEELRMLLAIDHSMRSTALVAFDRITEELLWFSLINPPKSMTGAQLIAYVWDNLAKKLGKVTSHELGEVAIEGLSFAAKGNSKDLLTGTFWYMCTEFYRMNVPVGKIPVTSWRAKVLSPEEQAVAKKTKDGIKKACVAKLPVEIRNRFSEYIKLEERNIRMAKGSEWEDSIYDLTDAYWIGKYSLSLAS